MGAPESAADQPAAAGAALEHEESEALNQSHKVLEQAFSVDSKSPDLVDQIADHSEPTSHNYFFEPYSSAARGWQPQLVHKQKLLPYPVAITSAYDNMRSGSFSGLLQEIHHAWVSVDNTLFLWDYTRADRFTAFEGMEQMISAVAIAKPIPGVFKSFVKHVLVVATASEMRLLVVLYENNDPVHGALRLQASKLCISTDDCTVKKIVSTADGRIFFGGSDGQLHEFVYDSEESMLHQLGWKRKCRKESHTQSLSNYIPSIFRTLTGSLSATGKIIDMVLDPERRTLYVLQDPATISVYDVAESEVTMIISKDMQADATRFCQRNHRTYTSCPEPRLFTTTLTLTSLSVIARDESASIHAVAVSSTGIRLYLSTFTPGYFSSNAVKRPSHLDVVHIRLPPPMLSLEDAPEYHVTEGLAPAILTGKSPSHVHKALYRKGVFLAIDGGPDAFDSVIGLCQDGTARHNQDTTSLKRLMRESISAESCQGKVSDVQEYHVPDAGAMLAVTTAPAPQSGTNKRSFADMMQSSSSSASTLPDEPKAMLSELVGQFFHPPRHFLVLTNAGLHIFQKIRPLDQLIRILHSTAPGKELTARLTHFVKCFGRAETCAMLFAVATQEPSTYAHVAVDAIFEFGGAPGVAPSGPNPAGNNSFILMDDMCMSYHHDGLVKFLARVLRPFWNTTNQVAAMESVRVMLCRLQAILATQYASALAHPAIATAEPSRFNTMTRTLNALIYESNPASLREENAIRAEQFSIRCLYRFTVRTAEMLSLLAASYRQNATTVAPLPLAELVTTSAGTAACKVLIQTLMAEAGHSEDLVHQLRDECPLLFADTDAAQCHGFQALAVAADCVTVHDQEVVLKKSLDHFRLASKTWTTEAQLHVLESICASYFAIGYLDGIVELSLTCARQLKKPDQADLRRIAYGCVLQCLHFFLLPTTQHDTLSICATFPAAWTQADEKETAVTHLLTKALASPDMQFHAVVYAWLYENDQQKRLIGLPSSANVEAYLQTKDEELLIKQYLLQARYVDAAHVLWNRAQEENPQVDANRDISQRLELISRAASVLAAANNPAATNALEEVRETLDVMQLQHNIWRTLEDKGVSDLQDLKYRILDVSVLYNQFAAKYQLWPDCLRIIRCCNTEDASTIQHLWEQLLFALIPKSAANVSFNQWLDTKHTRPTTSSSSIDNVVFESATWISHVQSQFTPLGKELVGSAAFPVEFIVHELEHLWMWFVQLTHYKAPQNWIAPFLLDCGVSYAHLFGVYNKLYEANEAPRWRFHLLRGIHDLVRLWQNHIQSRASRELVLEYATATPLLMSACESYVVDLHALVGDNHAEKHHMMTLFRQLKADVAATKSNFT
ncbi:Aste57867_12858 [Aphanomyces stellatus]|uniref:Aste57867_12858 protein n=1 Tax=Aphanomyces stellatus TaxID=120398 RepID=A0A485KY99_9STRA|nr:hypothetical protein As57867_012810 [Aphanomyces stellatus]VFT89705.1 Aste57867_12858 [Aphanomyces stellatus]